MWRSLNKNGKLILVSSITLISIIIFSILRDNSQLVDKKKISEIIESNKLKKAFVDEPYIYIYTKDNMVYKIAKEAVDLDKLFDKTIVYIKRVNWTGLGLKQLITYFIIY